MSSDQVEPDGSAPSPQRRPPVRLTRPRAQATQALRNALKIGGAIKGQRINNHWDLDQARAEKQEWVNRTAELLTTLFSDASMVELFNDWTGTVLPEYAEFELFVEQFVQEMKQRLARLQDILRRTENVREELPAATPTVAPAQRPAQPTAPVVVAPNPTPVTDAPSAETKPAKAPQGTGLLLMRSADVERRQAVVAFVQKLGLNLSVIGGTENASVANEMSCHADASFAIVLVDAAAVESGNFLFELGCCVGRLGAARVCVLQLAGSTPAEGAPLTLERLGARVVPVESAGDGWQLTLARNLKAGGLDVDLNRLV